MKSVPTDLPYSSEIEHCTVVLKKGGIILYPSDSLWGLGCDASDLSAIEKLIEIKGRTAEKSFISLVSSDRMLQTVVSDVPSLAWELIDLSDQPLTILYPAATTAFRHLASENGSIAVRMVKEGFAHTLLRKYGKPLISTSANFSGSPAPSVPSEIDQKLIQKLDYIVSDSGNSMTGRPSSMVQIGMDGRIKVIR